MVFLYFPGIAAYRQEVVRPCIQAYTHLSIASPASAPPRCTLQRILCPSRSPPPPCGIIGNGVTLRRLELLVHGLQHSRQAFINYRNGTSTVDRIALDVADEAFVRSCRAQNLEVHHVAQTLLLSAMMPSDDDDGLAQRGWHSGRRLLRMPRRLFDGFLPHAVHSPA